VDSNRILSVEIATGFVDWQSSYNTGFDHPYGITTDGTNLYVADTGNNTIKKVVINAGAITTLAGSSSSGSIDGTGAAASFNGPYGITTDGKNLYVADTGNNSIRRIQ
jgi:sugar lactone lactonase YvrE